MSDLYPDVQATWKAFAAHARACSACTPLADHQRRNPSEPPYNLMSACCEPGRQLAQAWYHACRTRIEAFKDRYGLRRV